MNCHLCGAKVGPEDTTCPYCGTKIKWASATKAGAEYNPDEDLFQFKEDEFIKPPPPSPAAPKSAPSATGRINQMALIGFVLSFVATFLGLICSVLGLQQCRRTGERGRGFAIAGIVISLISIALSITLAFYIADLLY